MSPGQSAPRSTRGAGSAGHDPNIARDQATRDRWPGSSRDEGHPVVPTWPFRGGGRIGARRRRGHQAGLERESLSAPTRGCRRGGRGSVEREPLLRSPRARSAERHRGIAPNASRAHCGWPRLRRLVAATLSGLPRPRRRGDLSLAVVRGLSRNGAADGCGLDSDTTPQWSLLLAALGAMLMLRSTRRRPGDLR